MKKTADVLDRAFTVRVRELNHAGERVLVVAHQVIVHCFRHLIEKMNRLGWAVVHARQGRL